MNIIAINTYSKTGRKFKINVSMSRSHIQSCNGENAADLE